MNLSSTQSEHKMVSVIWVHYHTPELLAQSIQHMTNSLRFAQATFELIVVDNGGLPDHFNDDGASQKVKVIRPSDGRNLGYAGGINLGVAVSQGNIIVVLNPDVLVSETCMRELMVQLTRTDIAAPQLYLDDAKIFKLPANESRDIVSSLLQALAHRSERFARLARNRWRTHVRGAVKAKHCFALNGAILAFTSTAWHALGPWDENYQLYFEESEWLLRAKRAGVSAAFAPRATASHRYAQSSRQQPLANEWFASSQVRFEQICFTTWQRWMLNWARRWASRQLIGAANLKLSSAHIERLPNSRHAELSSSVLGFPAVMMDLQEHLDFGYSQALRLVQTLPQGQYFLRWIDASGNELACQLITNEETTH